jgi:hypothetical protein
VIQSFSFGFASPGTSVASQIAPQTIETSDDESFLVTLKSRNGSCFEHLVMRSRELPGCYCCR